MIHAMVRDKINYLHQAYLHSKLCAKRK